MRNGGGGRPLNSVVSSQMIWGRFIGVLLLASLPSIAADGWALSDPTKASRRVTVTLSFHDHFIEKWTLPVAKDAPLLENHVVTKWVTFGEDRPGDVPPKLFTDTWLGTVSADEAWVRFMWWPDEVRDGSRRLKNDYIIIPFGKKEATHLENGLQLDVAYESAS
jgi:hypothetical protein